VNTWLRQSKILQSKIAFSGNANVLRESSICDSKITIDVDYYSNYSTCLRRTYYEELMNCFVWAINVDLVFGWIHKDIYNAYVMRICRKIAVSKIICIIGYRKVLFTIFAGRWRNVDYNFRAYFVSIKYIYFSYNYKRWLHYKIMYDTNLKFIVFIHGVKLLCVSINSNLLKMGGAHLQCICIISVQSFNSEGLKLSEFQITQTRYPLNVADERTDGVKRFQDLLSPLASQVISFI